MYAFGFQVGPFADHIDGLYDSRQASDQCGGVQNAFPGNFGFVCIPSLDQHARAAANAPDNSTFVTNTLAALNDFGSNVADIPLYSPNTSPIALTSMAGLVDQRAGGFSNSWSALDGRKRGYTPTNPLYIFGGGTNTIRWGQAGTPFNLNVFNAQFDIEATALGEVYDTLFRPSPVEPFNVLCWMCNTYSESADSHGNTRVLVQLRQNLRWHDGAVVDSRDVKFSLLNFRDQGAFSLLGQGARNVLDVKVQSSTTLEIDMRGQTWGELNDLAGVPIIPRHLWQLLGDTTYGDTPGVDPAKLDPSFDPLANDLLIGSGPYACVSIFPEDAGRIGTGCLADDMDNRSGQTLFSEGTLTLQQFDFTGQPNAADPFLQYMRSSNQGWGTGFGAHAESGQFQEFSWADRYDNATVNIRDLASVSACFGKSSPAGCPDYSYWLRSAFHPNSPATISTEIAIVASHLDDTWVYPFSWNGVQSQQLGQTLQDIVAFTP